MTRVGLSAVFAILLSAALDGQAPHGGRNARLQPGPNVNAVGGVVDPHDPAALVKADLNQQRQNETVAAASTRNPDHILAAANDYRFVDFPEDQFFGGTQNFLSRLVARLFPRPARRVPARTAAAIGAWTGVYRSCDRGRTWIGSAVPGSSLDFSDASNGSALKRLTELAELQGGHAETTDPVLVAGPGGRMHLAVLGFVRFPGGAVGDSRMYYVSYTDRNNREGGACFNYDFMREIDSAAAYAANVALNADGPFIDKPAIAVDKDGTLYVAYTVFSDSVKSRIVVARSIDGGATWKKTIPLLNAGFLRNHGAALTVDPLNGTVYLAWRMFFDSWPLMVISRSMDRGRTFLPATPMSHFWPARGVDKIIEQLKAARLQPFDQFSAGQNDPVDLRFRTATARSLAFPAVVAGVVNGRSRVFAAWTERADVSPGSATFGQPSATGSPRIMFSMSDNGVTWTPRRAIDAAPRRENLLQMGVGAMLTRTSGPQVQPVLTMSGTANGQLLLMYYESRDELDPATQSISGLDRILDVRALRIDPVTGDPLGTSVQVSQYPVVTNSSPAALPETAPGFRMANRQNLTMYSGGLAAFFGDYAHVSPSRPFEFKAGGWTWTSDASPSLAIWTDNRDVAFPFNADGHVDISRDWTKYTPIVPADPLATLPKDCSSVSSRNSNPYFTEIGGVIAGAPQSFKPLTIQRAFATYIENRTPDDRFFRLTIQDDEARGIDGSFDQFDFGAGSDVRNVKIFGNSGHHRTIWVQPRPQEPAASLSMLVQETTTLGGPLKADGYVARVVLNPDPNNDALTTVPPTAPQFAGDTTITADNSELHNPQVSAPQISTFRVTAPQVSSPQISAPQISSPQISTPQISAPQVSAPQISSPQISTPQISAAPPDEGNGTDVTYTVTNQGTTWTTYEALFNVPGVTNLIGSGNYQFQVLITRTSLVPSFLQTAKGCAPAARTEVQVIANVPVPQISSPQIAALSNPQISTPQISTPQIATFSIAPAGGADESSQNGTAAVSVARAAALATGNDDSHSPILRDEVKVTLRAIAQRPRAEILANGGTLFNPAAVVVRVASESTNVVRGVIDPDGTQPTDVTRLVPTVSVTGGTFAFDGNPHPATGFAFGVNGVNDVLSPALTFSYVGSGSTVYGPTPTAPSGVGTYTAVGTFAGNVNYIPASNSAVIIITGGGAAPETTLVSRPPSISLSRTARFTFTSSSASSTFACSLDTGPFTACTSPRTYSSLANGSHTLRVQAIDRGSTDPTPANFSWSVNVDANYEVLHYFVNPSVEPLNGFFPAAPLLESTDGFFYGTTLGDGTAGSGTAFKVDPSGLFVGLSSFPARAKPSGPLTLGTEGKFYTTGQTGGANGAGAIYRFDSGGNFAILHSLVSVTEGQTPTCGVIQGSDGFFYGTARGGGPLRNGTAFRMDAEGNLVVLHAFNGSTDGSLPLTLIQGPDGNLYGTALSGGSFNAGTVFRLMLSGELTVLHSFDPNLDGGGPLGGLVMARDGFFYGTTSSFAGAFGGTVYKIDREGRFAVVHRLAPATEGGDPRGELIQGSDGNVYGTTTAGGPTGGGTLFRMDSSGNLTVLHSFGGTGDGRSPIVGVVQASDGALYGTAETGPGTGNPPAGGVVFRFSLGAAAVVTRTVTTTANDGAGSLRQAILDANATPGVREEIRFNIPGAGPHTITVVSALPAMTDPVFINGASQPGYAGVPLIVVNGGGAGAGAVGFSITVGNSQVRALSIVGFNGTAIAVSGAGSNVIDGNYIGLLPDGVTGLGNGIGVGVSTPSNRIGGVTAAERNVISGNTGSGIVLSGAAFNLIEGNYIGTDANGATDLGNHDDGVSLTAGSTRNRIGNPGAGNVISGNDGHGIHIANSDENEVLANLIGTTAAGDASLGNGSANDNRAQSGSGIFIGSVRDTRIGGSVGGLGNVISGNGTGIFVYVLCPNTLIQGNMIGVNAAGTGALPNEFGIELSSSNITIGGAGAARNIISGNSTTGISVTGQNGIGNIAIHGNYIGTDVSGTRAIGNGLFGVLVANDAVVMIGNDRATGLGNVIGGNGVGVQLGTRGNVVTGNNIGAGPAGEPTVGNTFGVAILGSDNLIGGTGGLFNTIANNRSAGIIIAASDAVGNQIRENAISDNGELGIDIFGGGVNANDPGDADTGANNFQNYPVIASVTAGVETRFTGTLDTEPSLYLLRFYANDTCDPSGFGEGQVFLTSFPLAVESAGAPTPFDRSFAEVPVALGKFVTATATDALGNTSEFSACVPVTAAGQLNFAPAEGVDHRR